MPQNHDLGMLDCVFLWHVEIMMDTQEEDEWQSFPCKVLVLKELKYSAQVTVEESLMFSAQLRLMDVSKQDLRTFVNEVSSGADCA